MPVVPTTAYSQAEDALTLARALMNDSAGAVFTDALLMPLLNSAYRGLQRELAENGVSVLAEQQDIDLSLIGPLASPTLKSATSSPLLPADCLMPQMLWERDHKHHRHVRAHTEIHERRKHAELAARHLSSFLGVARGQNQSHWRDASHYGHPLRKNS